MQQRADGLAFFSPRRLSQPGGLAPFTRPSLHPQSGNKAGVTFTGSFTERVNQKPGAWAGSSIEFSRCPATPQPLGPGPGVRTWRRSPRERPSTTLCSRTDKLVSRSPVFVCRRMDINFRAEAAATTRSALAGSVSAAEALRLLGAQKQLLMEELEHFDTSGDNQIDLNELQQLLRLMGVASGHDAWTVAKSLMVVLDDDHTGKVDRHEFFQELNMSSGNGQSSANAFFASFEDPLKAFEAREQHRRSVIMARQARLASRQGMASSVLVRSPRYGLDLEDPPLSAGVYPPPSSPRANIELTS